MIGLGGYGLAGPVSCTISPVTGISTFDGGADDDQDAGCLQ